MLFRRLLLHTSRHVRPTMASSRSSSSSSSGSNSGTFGPLTGPKGTWPNDAKTGPKGKPMTPVPSASLIVLCPVSSRGRQEYATLTVQRSARDGSSFRSAIVFPGGVLDLADEDAIKRQAAGSLSPCTNTGAKDEEDAVYWQSLRLCALRETFEETGLVLLAADGPSQGLPRSRAVGPTEAGIDRQEWARIREEVHNDARAFTPFLARIASSLSGSDVESLLPPLAPMYHHSNWVTPRSIIRPAKRFDAHFFLTVLDKADVLGPLTSSPQGADSSKTSNLLNLSADGTETLSLRLATPQELVDLGCSDKVVMFPPQFYILSDLAASLRSPDPLASVRPLIFRRPEQSSPASSSSSPATTVEEEPRGLGGKNYNWDRMPSNPPALSWVSDKLPPLSSSSSSGRQDEGRLSVTSVMPRALPGSGTNVNLSSFSWRKDDATNTTEASGSELKKDNVDEEADEEGEESFVFPLVLPGDFLASKFQKRALWPPQAPSSSTTQSQVEAKGDVPLNRVDVSPRSKKDGGGLVIIGSVRRGQAGLMDFEEGRKLDVIGNIEELEEDDDEEDDEEEGSPRSKL